MYRSVTLFLRPYGVFSFRHEGFSQGVRLTVSTMRLWVTCFLMDKNVKTGTIQKVENKK